MAQTFAVNENNDLYLGPDGNIAMARDLQAVIFDCRSIAKAQLGEMIYATDQGIPNFETVWNGVPNLQQFEAALRANILSVPGVIGVDSVVVTQENNTLSYTISIVTIYGTGVVNG